MTWWWLVAYLVIGLICGVVAATLEHVGGATPNDDMSAGAVGLFVFLLWPLVLVAVVLGLTARWVSGKVGRDTE